MNCRLAQQQIFADREQTVSAADRKALAAHLSDCAACRELQAGYTSGLDSWRADTASVRVPNADLEWQRLRRKIAGESAEPVRRRWAPWLALPAAAAAAIALGVYLKPPQSPSGLAQDTATVARTTVTPEAAGSTVVYVDDKSGWTFVWTDSAGNGGHI